MSTTPTPVPPGAAPVPAAERGSTTVADRVVRRIAARSWAEALPGDSSGLPSATVSRTGRTASVTLEVALPYAPDLAGTGERAQRHVARNTSALTGLTVPVPDVRVTSLTGAVTKAPAGPTHVPEAPAQSPRAPRRPWSPRRGPAVLVLCAGTAVGAYLLAEGLARRTGHVLPGTPRPDVLHRVAVASLADSAALVAGVTGVVLGLWLLGAALLPGRRDRLPMAVGTPDTRAVLDRSAVALLVRDEALAVPGVTSARVRVGRRRVKVRAAAGYGELGFVREQLRVAVESATGALGVARPLRPQVRLRAADGHVEETGA